MEDDDEYSAHETSVGYFKKIGRDKNGVEKAICRGCKEPYRVGSTPGPNGKNYGTSHLKRELLQRKAATIKLKLYNLYEQYANNQIGTICSYYLVQTKRRRKSIQTKEVYFVSCVR
ncbi:hypothetical protein H5410_063060 [Solanum commersonii]|uniref:BED-type domain-containing protein n=1 Tax=Solanum commersonii TaxID=4109 RepID=A0A9J5WEI3_SOLCO|nr:hypothetical protein H5410_063060 [Solanum commersonii]